MAKKKLSQLKGRDRIERVMQLARNPDTRASVPTSMLRGFAGADKLRAERAKNARLNAPVVPGSETTVRQVARDREAAVGLRFGDQDRDIQNQLDQSTRREQQAQDWFSAYKSELARLQGEQAARHTALQGQMAQFGGDAQQQDTAQAQQLNAEMQKAQPQGVQFDPTEANARAVQASDARRRLNDSAGQTLVRQNAATQDLLTDRRANVVPMAELAERRREGDRKREILNAQQDVAKRKGDFRTTYTADRTESERKGVLERLVFGADVAKDQADIDIKRGVDPVTGKPLPKPKKEPKYYYGVDSKTWAKMNPEQRAEAKRKFEDDGKPDKPSGKDQYGNTVKERRAAQNNYATARSTANKYKSGVNGDWRLLRDFILTKGVKEPMATAAAQQAILGKVGPNTRGKMSELGVPIVNEPTPKTKISRPGNAPGIRRGQERPT